MIAALVIAIAGAGAVFVAMLASRLHARPAEATLKQHRSHAAGLADLLNYAAVVDDGIVVCKNGTFLAAWRYQGEDNASSTDVQRDTMSHHINQALASLGSGWMVHVDAVRQASPTYPPANQSHFPDRISEAIDEERRNMFESMGAMYEGYFVLAITWFPPLLAQRKFVELMFDDDAVDPGKKALTYGLIDTFKRECSTLESRLSSALTLNRLRGHQLMTEEGVPVMHDGLLSWLQLCVTGLSHPMQLPSNPMYLDAVIGGQELFGGVVPRIGRNFIQVVALEGFPMDSTPGMLTALGELPCAYRWSSRFIFMDTHEAVAHLNTYRKKWRQKIRGFFDQVFHSSTGPVDHDAIAMVNDAEAAIADVNSGVVAQGYYTSVVVLMDEDRHQLSLAARQVEKTINRLGFAARVETINTMDAYLGSLPGHGVENVRRPIINTLNLADLLPVSTIWTGEDKAPCPMYPPNAPALMHGVTQGATPFRLNLHVHDLGHAFLFGPTGAGKSTHLGMIAAQLRRYAGMSIFVFDKGMSMYPLVKATGGNHFVVGGDDDRLAFCPLQFLSTASDRIWAMEWIDSLLALNNLVTSATQRNEIANAICSMQSSGARTLSEFSVTIQDEPIREALRQYTVDGQLGQLLDAEEDGLSLAEFTCFEIDALMNLGEKYALPTLMYLFRRIECSLHGQPGAIILDEAWLMLGHPVFRSKIREWLKTMRKANCLVLMATQSLSDAVNSGILDVIVESTATRIYLPNAHARDEDAAALYHRMGLNDRQIEIIATAVPKRQYYVVSSKGRRLYELILGPVAMSLVGATDKESIAEIHMLEQKWGIGWVDVWLAQRGIKLVNDGVQHAPIEETQVAFA